MILTAHQPVYLPWLGLFHKIALADEFIVFDQVQYQKRDWNNRNKISTCNGEVWLTVPVKGKNHFQKIISDIEIDNSSPWAKKHWKTISLNYSKAPFFDRYKDFFEHTFNTDWSKLSDLTNYMLDWFLNTLNIRTKVSKASDYNFAGIKSDLVLDMCKKKDASIYIFGAEGKNYANVEDFHAQNVSVYFQNYNHPIYQQKSKNFISHLSIVDLLFNCGDESFDILMTNNIDKNQLLKIIHQGL